MILEKLQSITTFIFDVDGILTNGNVLVNEQGEQLRSFNIKDGYAIQLAVKRGFRVAIISGAKSNGVELRLKGLGIQNIFLGIDSKIEVYNSFKNIYKLCDEDIIYMGDDIPDLSIMKVVGIPVSCADAVEEVKATAHYVSSKNGGEGCVRDIIEKVLKVQGKWYDALPSANDGKF